MRIKVETYSKFAELLNDCKFKCYKIIERAKILKKDESTGETVIDSSTGN